MRDWQSRTEMLIGEHGISKLQKSHILIAGLGGVGSWAVESLARSGVGELTLVDKDVVDISNINRQLPALIDTVGQVKVEAMSQRVKRINPDIKINLMQLDITPLNVTQIIESEPNYIIDAIDTISAKVALITLAKKYNIPIISAMGAGNRLNPAGFQVADINTTHTCPLARAVRQQLRKNGVISGVKVVFNPQNMVRPVRWDMCTVDESQPRKMQYPPASMVFAPAVCGLTLAAEVVQDLIKELE